MAPFEELTWTSHNLWELPVRIRYIGQQRMVIIKGRNSRKLSLVELRGRYLGPMCVCRILILSIMQLSYKAHKSLHRISILIISDRCKISYRKNKIEFSNLIDSVHYNNNSGSKCSKRNNMDMWTVDSLGSKDKRRFYQLPN